MDITRENSGKIIFFVIAVFFLGYVLGFTSWIQRAPETIRHWTYLAYPTCRSCDVGISPVTERVSVNYGLPQGWDAVPYNDSRGITLRATTDYVIGSHRVSIGMSDEAFANLDGTFKMDVFVSTLLKNHADIEIVESGDTYQFGRNAQYIKYASKRDSFDFATYPRSVYIYFVTVDNLPIQILATRPKNIILNDLTEADQLDMVLNSITFD